jgi:hypothetical protein
MLSNNINSWYIITYSKIKKPPSLVQQDKEKKRLEWSWVFTWL